MNDIELVIKIDKAYYDTIKDMVDIGLGTGDTAIANGIPLPKGHGRIADVDKMLDEMRATRTYDILFALERVKPIIKADKERCYND